MIVHDYSWVTSHIDCAILCYVVIGLQPIFDAHFHAPKSWQPGNVMAGSASVNNVAKPVKGWHWGMVGTRNGPEKCQF